MEGTIGEIRMFAGNFAPRNWAFCAGQLMSISQNTALFSLLGTTYGGNGQTTFALPDFRGRVAVGTGQGPGLPNITLGEVSGEPTHTLISTEMPSHTHALVGSSADANSGRPGGGLLAKTGTSIYVNTPADTPMSTAAIGLTGGSQPHNNMQ